MEKEKLFLWLHMHQPDYYDPILQVQILPWVRRGALKGYQLIPRLLSKTSFKVNVNFSGILLEQLLHYESLKFIDLYEGYENFEAKYMTDGEIAFVIKNLIPENPCFSKRSETLHEKKVKGERLNLQDIIDAQVLYKLSAFAPLDDLVFELLKKGKNFTEEDKNNLIGLERRTLANIIPLYRELADKGQIELTFTPYHHPILPLLIDFENARKSKTSEVLPQVNSNLIEDAREHIRSGIEIFENVFGVRPSGMWPAEGSISQEVFDLSKEYGIKWIGSDELVLKKTSTTAQGAYTINGIKGFFRSHEASDRIGFIYNKVDAFKAIEDLQAFLKQQELLVLIIDGENPWEYYPNSGVEFLGNLFEKFGKYSILGSEVETSREVQELSPGSWINGNFDTWIGNIENNTAWTYLISARNELRHNRASVDELHKAEGSDYFWWYSNYHKHETNGVFDELFRHRLIKAYQVANVKVPEYLFIPIKNR